MGDTVWLASYPKSGNTWFRSVYTAWRRQGDLDLNHLDGPIASSRWRVDTALGISSDLLAADEIDRVRPLADEALDRSADGPHLCKTHDAFFAGPDGSPVLSVAATRCAIYIVRDPRDVAVSFAHHEGVSHETIVARMNDPEATLSQSTRGVGHQVRQRLGTWTQHVTSWLHQAPFPVHLLRYEDCLTDPVSRFTEALRFAGFDALTEEIKHAVDAAHFERLQKREASEGFRERPRSAAFFRRGISGAWADELAPELATRIRLDHQDVLRDLRYEERGLDPDQPGLR